jgi:hypothetical protein
MGDAFRLGSALAIGVCALGRQAQAAPSDLAPSAVRIAEVHRSERAASCPDLEVLTRLVVDRTPRLPVRSGVDPVVVQIDFDADGAAYTARLRVFVPPAGTRSLRVEGEDCSNLRDALLLSLQVLVDELLSPDPLVPPEPRALAPSSPAAPERQAAPEKPVSIWFGAGAAATLGVPNGASGAVFGRASLRFDRSRLVFSGFWSPPQRVRFGPGELALSAAGAQLSGCADLVRWRAVALGGCLAAAGLALSAQAFHFSTNGGHTRPWWLGGFGPDVSFSPDARLSFGVRATALASFHRESFSVDSLGSGYVTPEVIGWAEVDAQVRFW